MGSVKSGRPGGNPDLEKYHFKPKYDWDQPCSEKVSFRVPLFLKTAIKEGKIKDWQEICRQAIAAELEKNPPQEEQKN